jgi:hypothetical protein
MRQRKLPLGFAWPPDLPLLLVGLWVLAVIVWFVAVIVEVVV